MRTAAVLPIKRLDQAKQRLGGALLPSERALLAGAMIADVLDALRASAELDRIIVVSGEPFAQELAHAAGAIVVEDPQDAGQSAAAQRGIERAFTAGCERVLLVPGDCPALDVGELDRLLGRRAVQPELVVVPDRHGAGTNALLISPPDAVAPAFGPGSCERHLRLAAAANVAARVEPLASLALDVDTREDLAALRHALESSAGGAMRTRAMLARLLAAAA